MVNLGLSKVVNVGRQIARAVRQVLNSNQVTPRELVNQLTRNQDIKLGLDKRIASFDFGNGYNGQSYISLLDQLINVERDNLGLQQQLKDRGMATQTDLDQLSERISNLDQTRRNYKQEYVNHLLSRTTLNPKEKADVRRQISELVNSGSQFDGARYEALLQTQRQLEVESFYLAEELRVFGFSNERLSNDSVKELNQTGPSIISKQNFFQKVKDEVHGQVLRQSREIGSLGAQAGRAKDPVPLLRERLHLAEDRLRLVSRYGLCSPEITSQLQDQINIEGVALREAEAAKALQNRTAMERRVILAPDAESSDVYAREELFPEDHAEAA